MKRLLTVLLSLLLVLCIAGCDIGTTTQTKPTLPDPTTPSQGNEPEDPSQGDPVTEPEPQEEESHYTVSVFYKNARFNPNGERIYAVWQNSTERIEIPLDEEGRADAGELDGDYAVRLVGLPARYTHNPNEHTATRDVCGVQIILTDALTPKSGDGSDIYTAYGCYSIELLGNYRAELISAKPLYYEFKPAISGKYIVESHVDVYEDSINPLLEIYGGTSAFKWLVDTMDDGGYSLSGGYTKNFRWNINVPESEVGAAYTFGVKAETKSGEYPADVVFSVTLVGDIQDYNQTETITVKAEEATFLPKISPNGEYHYADLETKLFSGRNVKYNEATKLYHVYSMKAYPNGAQPSFGAGYGPYLCCEIKAAIPSYTLTTLYEADKVGDPGWEDQYKYNYLIFTTVNPNGVGYLKYDYTDFIRVSYAKACNADGVCPVTKELKDFLQSYAVVHTLWTDRYNPVQGSPEYNGYDAIQDDLWLFACGFYESDSAKIRMLIADRNQ